MICLWLHVHMCIQKHIGQAKLEYCGVIACDVSLLCNVNDLDYDPFGRVCFLFYNINTRILENFMIR